MGMQKRSLEILYNGSEILGHIELSVRSVKGISYDGMSDMGKMNTNLMRSSGLEDEPHQGDTLESLFDPPPGDCMSPPRISGGHPFSVFGMPADRCIHDALVFLRRSMDEPEIFSKRRMRLELL